MLKESAISSEGQPQSASSPAVLTIAGFDPSSGAGVTADLKVFAAHRFYGLAAITALTIQSTQGVRRVEPISPDTLRQTLKYLAEDIEIKGIKIGMLATEDLVATVAEFLAQSTALPEMIVLDPVLQSSSGHPLLSPAGVRRLKKDLLPRVGWITPNTSELAVLTGIAVPSHQAVPEAAARLATDYPGLNIVVTGGHLDPPDDFLRTADGVTHHILGERVETRATHGTGCAFSSALLAQVVAGAIPAEAVSAAKAYVVKAMRAARPLGKGRGPLHHLYRFG